jgi:hypothetical protein
MKLFLKTPVDNKTIESILKRHLYIDSFYVNFPSKLNDYLNSNFNVEGKDVLKVMRDNIRIIKYNDLSNIIFFDVKINDKISLMKLLQLIEYGNRDVQGSKIITNLLTQGLREVRNDLGGL